MSENVTLSKIVRDFLLVVVFNEGEILLEVFLLNSAPEEEGWTPGDG